MPRALIFEVNYYYSNKYFAHEVNGLKCYLRVHVQMMINSDIQVMRKWRFRTSVVNQLSSECKQQVTALMEPEAKARPTAGNIFNGAWIGMDPRLTSKTLFFAYNLTYLLGDKYPESWLRLAICADHKIS